MKLAAIIFGTSIFFVIVLGNTLGAIAFFPYYEDFLSQSGSLNSFDHPLIATTAAYNIYRFLLFHQSLDTEFFSNQAIRHMADVQNIISMGEVLLVLVLGLGLGAAYFLMRQRRQDIIVRSLLIANWSVVTFCLLVAALAATNFTDSFTTFHQMLFQNNLWLFDGNDSLIRLFPQQFFVLFVKQIVVNTLVTSTVVLIALYSQKYLAKK